MYLSSPPASGCQAQLRILIIEDAPLIAASIQSVLEQAGFSVVGIATKLEKALMLIEDDGYDAAIVDANLAGVSAAPAAAALAARLRPFIVLSGYSRDQMDGDFSGGLYLK